MDRPRVLILDDGELDRVFRALERAHLASLRVSGDAVLDGLPMPCDLLVTSGARTLAMPCLNVASPGPAPTWVCVHTQDFHPLRDRLRNLGVHYLVQSSADDRTLDLFLGQVLHSGSERRREPRLPIGCELSWTWKTRSDQKAALLDLSPRGVRIAMQEELPVGAVLDLTLPAQLAGEPIEVTVRVARCEVAHAVDGDRFEVLLVWDELEPERRLLIDELVSGNRIGPRVAPLTPRPYIAASGIPDWGELRDDADRRLTGRHRYDGHVDAFGAGAPIGALGRDLSQRGLRIAARDGARIELGDELTLALHSSGSEEPLLVAARAARRDPDGALLLLFTDLDESARTAIARMLEALPCLEDIGGEAVQDAASQRVVATEITHN